MMLELELPYTKDSFVWVDVSKITSISKNDAYVYLTVDGKEVMAELDQYDFIIKEIRKIHEIVKEDTNV